MRSSTTPKLRRELTIFALSLESVTPKAYCAPVFFTCSNTALGSSFSTAALPASPSSSVTSCGSMAYKSSGSSWYELPSSALKLRSSASPQGSRAALCCPEAFFPWRSTVMASSNCVSSLFIAARVEP